MTITLSVSGNPTSTTAQLALANIGASGSVEVQISQKKDFSFCVAPVITGLALSSPVSLIGLNQASSYFARARTRLSTGIAEQWSNVVGFYTPQAAAQQGQGSPIVMQPALLVVPTPIIGIVGLTNSSGGAGEVAGFPATNLLIDSPVAWKASSSNGQFFIQVNTAGAPVDTFALLRTNLPEATQISVTGALSQASVQGTSPPYGTVNQPFRASANLPGRPGGYHGIVRLPAPQSYPWWQINILTPAGAPPGGLLSAEHFIMGLSRVSKTQTLNGVEQGVNLGSMDRNRAGVADRQDGYRMRHVEFDISYMTETQYQTLYRDLHQRTNEAVLIVPNAIADGYLHDRILYGALGSGKSTNPSSIHQTKSFVIDSLI